MGLSKNKVSEIFNLFLLILNGCLQHIVPTICLHGNTSVLNITLESIDLSNYSDIAAL